VRLSVKILRWLDPKQEENRKDFRMCLTENMANAEDVTRTVRLMNGHLSDHPLIQEWRLKK
jgi:hypothetical protein